MHVRVCSSILVLERFVLYVKVFSVVQSDAVSLDLGNLFDASSLRDAASKTKFVCLLSNPNVNWNISP